MSRKFFTALAFLICLKALLASPARGQENEPWDQPIELSGDVALPGAPDDTKTEYPPGDRVPDGPALPPLDSNLMITPAPEIAVRGGYAAYGDNTEMNHGAGVGVLVFMEHGSRLNLALAADVLAGQGGISGEGDLRARYRFPIDPKHIFWTGFGVDIAGRGATDGTDVGSYLKAQLPVGFLGTMFTVKDTCTIHIFAKAAFGIYDNQSRTRDPWAATWDNFARPAVGGETFAQCANVRILGGYEYVFNFGEAGDTHRARLELSQAWPVSDTLQLGYFVKGNVVHEAGIPGAAAGDPYGDPRTIGGVFTGLEVRFGKRGLLPSKKK